jgi:transcriptional regulator with XRE-family HTH domain
MPAAHTPQYIEFVSRLRNARRAKKLTQRALGQRLGKPQAFVSKVETCERRLDLIEVAEWCLALDITLDQVLPPGLRKALFRESDERGPDFVSGREEPGVQNETHYRR